MASSVQPGGVTAGGTRTPVQLAALVVGIVFLAVGVLGFVPGVTSGYSSMSFAGHMSDAKLLGVFQVSVLHNVVHLLFGVAGIVLSRTPARARSYLVYGGIVYAVLFVYGVVIDQTSGMNFVPINTADNWLHAGLAVGMVLLGVVLGRRTVAAPTR